MRILWRFLRTLCRAAVWTALLLLVAVLAALMVLQRELPDRAARWVERQLSQGDVCVRFGRASFSLWDGLTCRSVRVHAKRSLAPPLLTVGDVRITGRIRRDRPPLEWIDAIAMTDLSLTDIPSDLDFGSSEGALLRQLKHPVQVTVTRLSAFGSAADRCMFQLQRHGTSIHLADARVTLPSSGWMEEAAGACTYDRATRQLRLILEGRATPTPLLPAFEALGAAETAEICRRFSDYTAPLRVACDFTLTPAEPGAEPGRRFHHDLRLRIDGEGLRYLGQPVQRLHASIQAAGTDKSRVTASPLIAELDQGRAECSLVYDPVERATDLVLKSTVPAAALLHVLRARQPLPPGWVIESAPVLTVSGRVASQQSDAATALSGSVEIGQAAVKGLAVQRFAGRFAYAPGRAELSDASFRCNGGAVSGGVALAWAPAGATTNFALRLGIDNLNLQGIAASYGQHVHPTGWVSGGIALDGALGWQHLPQLSGSGDLWIRDGTLSRVRLFAGLTDYLAEHVPGVESLVQQSDARLPFAISNGVLTADAILVEGDFFSMKARGHSRLSEPTNQLDFVVQARFFKQKTLAGTVARFVTFPFSKLMEFHVTGPVRKPRWTYIGIIDRILDIAGPERGDTQPDANP